jgi:nitrite reductase/ring-hydroxylating ferredoxin subunit
MTDQATNDLHTCPFDRRTVLGFGVAVAAVAVTAGCGTDKSGAEAEAAPAPSASPSPSSSNAHGSHLPDGALTLVAQVPVGGGVVVPESNVLVVQPTEGVFKAYDARCTHKGVPVNPPDAEGVVVCPKHKARFKASDGSVVKGPAERALSGIPVKVDGEYVVRA